MNIIPPLTSAQCQVIIEHYEFRARDARAQREHYLRATQAEPLFSAAAQQAYLTGLESAALYAEQQAALAQLHALQALDRLDLTKGAKLA
jgi:hypothetical protein